MPNGMRFRVGPAARAALCAALALAAADAAMAADTPADGRRGQGKGTDAQGNPSPVLLNADEITYDDQLETVIARGNVELTQAGRTLLADVVSYNQRSDTVTASGHVSVIEDATGETTFGNFVELHDEMRNGFIRDLRMLLADRTRLAGNTARRSDANTTEIRRGIYSPCDLCQEDPTQPPVWDFRANTIVHDHAAQRIEYEDVTLDIDGWPVLWSPYFSHPDPTVKRQSGFLAPSIGSNSLLGVDATLPYYWVIDRDKDLTITPTFTGEQGEVLELEYRERFADGVIDLVGSVNWSNPNAGPEGNGGSGDSRLRGHIVANGEFDIDADLRAGFSINRTSDIVYLEEFKFGGYQTFLNSSAYVEDFEDRNYGSIFAYDFQSLRLGVSDGSQPIVLPVADYTWAGRPLDWGGRFTTSVNAADLVVQSGPSERRISAGEEFDLPFDGPLGERFNFVAGLRGDLYSVSGEPRYTNGPVFSGPAERIFPQLGLEWRYPFIRYDKAATWLLEPKVAVYAAPVGLNSSKIPNQDSQAVDFNDTDLFTRNRFMGYDQVDSGQRVDYGLHGAWTGSGTDNVDFLVGQSYRFQKESPFAIDGAGDGLEYQRSDMVGRIAFTPSPILDMVYRFRLAETDFSSERQEVSTNFNLNPVRLSFTYLQIGENVRDEETPRQQISTAINLKINPFWTLTLTGTHDLSGDGHLLAAGIGAQYSDECLTFVATLGEDGTVIGNYRPGTTILFQLVLKNIGEIVLPSLQTGLSAG
jgi:LPS-assembly protein